MIALRVRLLVLFLKFKVKSRMKSAVDIAEIRQALGGVLAPAPRGVGVTAGEVGGVSGEWLQTRDPGPLTLLYVHGGAFIACSPHTHRTATGALAKQGFRVFAVDYRLAPEHKYPAALDDVEAAYRGLLASGVPAGSLVAAGESAGGNLVLALLHRLRERGVALPAAIAAWSPLTDWTGASPSLTSNADRDAMLDGGGGDRIMALYLEPGTDPTTPTLSPLFGDYTAMPPILVHVGNDEVLRDDGVRLADKAREAGVIVELKVWPLVPHAWQLFPFLSEAGQSIAATAAFLKRHATPSRATQRGVTVDGVTQGGETQGLAALEEQTVQR